MKDIKLMRRSSILALFALITTLGQPAAQGQSKPDLPTAETVLNQYIEATGGQAAYKKVTSRVLTGTIEISGANLMGTIKVTQAAPDKLMLVMNLGPIGETKQGTDGKVDVYPSDYKSVDGVLIPFTATQKVLTQQIVMKMKEVKHNVNPPPDLFRRPAPPVEPAKKKAD